MRGLQPISKKSSCKVYTSSFFKSSSGSEVESTTYDPLRPSRVSVVTGSSTTENETCVHM